MTDKEIREGDIVEIDYIEEFTKEHINEGKALVIWKGFNHQPLVRKLDTKNTIWTCYEHISKVVGHIDIEDYMDKALEQEPMQVELEGDGYADGKLVYDYGKCPKCGWDFEEGDKDWGEPYCCHCGQKLKWFDNKTESEDT